MRREVRYGPEMRILIVGAGVAGLSMASHLRIRGSAPDLIEPNPSVPRPARGSQAALIFPTAAGVLKGLGIFREFLRHASPIDALQILDAAGREVRTVSLARFFEPYGGAFVGTRARIAAQIHDIAGPVRGGVAVESMEQDDEGVDVVLSDGTQGRYDVLVGADGLRSHVRDRVFGPVGGTFWDGRAWSFDLVPRLDLEHVLTEVWAPGRFVGLYQSPEATHCLMAAPASVDDDDPIDARTDRVRDLFRELGGPMPEILERLPGGRGIASELLFDLRMDSWSRGRVVFLGDAAHATIPVVGLGHGASLISGAVLSSELTRSDSAHFDAAWSFYIQRRKHRIDIVQDRARERFSMLSVRHRFAAWTRDEVLKATSDERFLAAWQELLTRPA